MISRPSHSDAVVRSSSCRGGSMKDVPVAAAESGGRRVGVAAGADRAIFAAAISSGAGLPTIDTTRPSRERELPCGTHQRVGRSNGRLLRSAASLLTGGGCLAGRALKASLFYSVFASNLASLNRASLSGFPSATSDEG